MNYKGHRIDKEFHLYGNVDELQEVANEAMVSRIGGAAPGWLEEPYPEISFRHLIDRIRNQNPLSSCVGCAVARSCHMRGHFLGYHDMDYPAELGIYTLARMREKRLTEPLQDIGCFPHDAYEMAATWGLAPEDKWPFDPKLVNIAPTPDNLQAAADYKALKAFAIYETGDERALRIRQMLCAGMFPTIAITCDDTFEKWDGAGVMTPLDGTNRGSHYVTVIGYDVNKGPDQSYEIVNSWGENWADGGFGFLPKSRIIDARDVRCVEVVPCVQD